MNARKPHWWQSKTILSALLAGASTLLSPEVLNLLPAQYATVGKIIGAVGVAVGLRTAVVKHGNP